jgi:hypothetical protein
MRQPYATLKDEKLGRIVPELEESAMDTGPTWLVRNQAHHATSGKLKEVIAPANAAARIAGHPENGSDQVPEGVKPGQAHSILVFHHEPSNQG